MPRMRFLAVLPLLCLAACGTQTIKEDEIETQVAQRVEQVVGAPVDVDCPDDAKAEKGTRFNCEVEAEDDTKATAAVRVTAFDEDAKPPVKSDFKVPVIPTKAIEEDAAKQLRSQIGQVTVDCPTLVATAAQVSMDCPITAPAKAKADGIAVKVTGTLNALQYETVDADG